MKRMPHCLIAFSFLLLINARIYGQEKGDHEFTIGYGVTSTNKMANDVAGSFSGLFSLVTSSMETRSSGAFHLGYKYAVSKKIKIGAVVAHEELVDEFRNTYFSQSGEFSYGYTTIAIESDVRYILKENFQMYSGLGLGYSIMSSDSYDDQTNYMNFHLSAIGIRIGTVVALRLELGIGYKGILNGGISVQI